MKIMKMLVVVVMSVVVCGAYTHCGFFTNDSSLPTSGGEVELPSGEGPVTPTEPGGGETPLSAGMASSSISLSLINALVPKIISSFGGTISLLSVSAAKGDAPLPVIEDDLLLGCGGLPVVNVSWGVEGMTGDVACVIDNPGQVTYSAVVNFAESPIGDWLCTGDVTVNLMLSAGGVNGGDYALVVDIVSDAGLECTSSVTGQILIVVKLRVGEGLDSDGNANLLVGFGYAQVELKIDGESLTCAPPSTASSNSAFKTVLTGGMEFECGSVVADSCVTDCGVFEPCESRDALELVDRACMQCLAPSVDYVGSCTCWVYAPDPAMCEGVCGDGTCDAGESCSTCYADCSLFHPACSADSDCTKIDLDYCYPQKNLCYCSPLCGDGRCDVDEGESCSTCYADCAQLHPNCIADSECTDMGFDYCDPKKKWCYCNAPVCGNNIVEWGEECEDGNTTNTDACVNCQNAKCSDGFVQADVDQCDDGNAVDGDCCSALCTFEAAASTCDDGNACSTGDQCNGAGLCSGTGTTCGDGVLDDVKCGEQCDDGDNDNGDGCSAICQTEFCGDGSVNNNDPTVTEQCDDGVGVDGLPVGGDGCSATCQTEFCGDGSVNNNVPEVTEQCDDGNTAGGDDCSATCQLERCGNGIVDVGEFCDDGINNANTAACLTTCQSARCGDGFVQAGVEQCDDGINNANTAACLTTCQNAFCGDGYVQAGVEQCEDGNTSNTDACVNCQNAKCGDGYVRAGAEQCDNGIDNADTAACTTTCKSARCGDRFVYAGGGEECDDGNTINTDACITITCKSARCGDTYVRAGVEQCDGGNTNPCDGCSATCQLECGNGVIECSEVCDDSNRLPCDGCSMTCQVEAAHTCGNGVPELCEYCDDGNLVNGDGCSAMCTCGLRNAPCSGVLDCCSGICTASKCG